MNVKRSLEIVRIMRGMRHCNRGTLLSRIGRGQHILIQLLKKENQLEFEKVTLDIRKILEGDVIKHQSGSFQLRIS